MNRGDAIDDKGQFCCMRRDPAKCKSICRIINKAYWI